MLTVTLTEPNPAIVLAALLEQASTLPLEQLSRDLGELVEVQRSADGTSVSLSPGTMIGTLRVGELRIDVRPRLGAADLARLIRYAYGSEFEPIARSQVQPDQDGLDELLCGVLADELTMIRQRGLSRLYVRRREAMTAVRGRVDFVGSFPWNDGGMASVVCQYHELSCNNLDNQIIVAALDQAMLLEISQRTRCRLTAHRHAWHEISSARPVALAEIVKARSLYTRLTEHYRLAHHLSESILLRLRPRSLFESSDLVTAGLSLDMAELFELAVYRLLKEALGPAGFTVRYQETDSYALHDGQGDTYRRVRPDLIVFRDDIPVCVIDAKYKDYWEWDPSKQKPFRKISNEDIYQLFFYASRLQSAYGLPITPPAVIISPAPAPFELAGREIISSQFRTVRLSTGGGGTNLLLLSLLPLSHVLGEMDHSLGEAAHRLPSLDQMLATLPLKTC